jgi:hypothetical protein
MNILVNADGRRNVEGRPFIDQEELKRNVLLYDPNGYNLNTGLYDRSVPSCSRWVDYFHQDQMKTHRRPSEMIDGNGRTTYLWGNHRSEVRSTSDHRSTLERKW